MGRPRKVIEGAEGEEPEANSDPLVLTVSELQKLSPEEKTKFRFSGGTVIEDPIN
jgi:hypothetical protein